MDLAMLLGASGTSTLAVGVTVVATLVVVALVAGLVQVVRSARELRRVATALSIESAQLLAALDEAVSRADRQVRRVDDLVGSAESISDAVGSASRLASTAISGPVIKAMAFGAGAARAGRRLRDGPPPPPSRALGSGRRRARR
jgi:methyl-accepting chemotaxis protein